MYRLAPILAAMLLYGTFSTVNAGSITYNVDLTGFTVGAGGPVAAKFVGRRDHHLRYNFGDDHSVRSINKRSNGLGGPPFYTNHTNLDLRIFASNTHCTVRRPTCGLPPSRRSMGDGVTDDLRTKSIRRCRPRCH